MLDEFITGAIRALHAVPLVAPYLFLRAYRRERPHTAVARLLPLLLASVFAYLVWGMNYEDANLPDPLWWQCGLAAACVELVLAFVGIPVLIVRPSLRRRSIASASACVMAGVAIGGATNMVNGAVSPLYFSTVMGWHNVDDLWATAVAQGLFEGLIYGILYAVVFTSVIAAKATDDCTTTEVLRYVIATVAAVLLTWAMGGSAAMGLASMSPELFGSTFGMLPKDSTLMLRYAWVGGSISAAILGGLFLVVVSAFHFARKQAPRLVN